MNNKPSLNPADNGSLAGTIQLAFNKLLQNINGMLPAQVIKYDRDTNRVQVQLLITMITTDGSLIPRSQIASIPVLLLGGGGYFLSFPIQTGDLGWVLANDRDISLFLQSYSQAAPNTYRKFSFSDGLFIPDIMKGYTLNEEDSEHAVLQNLDGSVRLSLWPDKIKVTGNFMVDGDITATGDITPHVPP